MAEDPEDVDNEDEDIDSGLDGEEGEEGAEGEEGGEKKKPGLVKLGLFIGLPVVILALGGVAAWLFLFSGGEEEHLAEGEHAEEAEELYEPHYVEFSEPILININNEDGNGDILMLELNIVVKDEESVHAVEERMREIMDGYIGFLRELRTDDLVGSAAYHRLRLELLRRTNLAIAPAEADDVLIVNLAVN